MVADGLPAAGPGGLTLCCLIWPTLLDRPEQTIAARWDAAAGTGFRLVLRQGGELAVVLGYGPGRERGFALSARVLERKWYALRLTLDAEAGTATLEQAPVLRHALIGDEGCDTQPLGGLVPPLPAALHLAGAPHADGSVGAHYNGKIDSVVLFDGVATLAAYWRVLAGNADPAVAARWDFSRDIPSTIARDIGPHGCHGALVHLPARGMKGWNWTGEFHDWRRTPEQYGAIHFHEDDLYDAGWETDFSLTIPDDLRSGAYAVHLSSGENTRYQTREEYLPFYVRPSRDPAKRGTRPPIAFLAPTCAYMAYANDSNAIISREAESIMGRLLTVQHGDMFLHDHPEYAASLYDTHADGSGVCYSSRLRPIVNMRPRFHSWVGGHGSGLWQYNADTHILDWLEHEGFEFDVITDEDLHFDPKVLADYRVVLTGTHPEYHSTAMWDSLKAWQDHGGRLMYLGANGWYWRVAFHPTLPAVIEVRRAEDGIRTWEAEPGEYFHSFSGEYGGLWRRIGRPPNMMCGVGFIAQGFDISSYYRRAPDADNPRAAFIFDGVPDEIIGDFGLVGGGAAGLEIDCINVRLGSPPNALRLATSENHTTLVQLVNEEFTVVPPALGGDQNEKVRADLTFYETASGGAVFSVGSIAWPGSLSHNGYDNNVAKITGNVLRRFADPAPFPTS
jgi:N,N-dimethylformamidase